MTGLAVGSVLALLGTVFWAAERDPPPGDQAHDVVRVGVVEGQSVPGYLAGSRDELAALLPGTPTWALITLAGYRGPDRLAPLLGGSSVAQVYARAPIRDAQTQVVRIPVHRMPGDVVAGMLAAATHRDQEQAEYQRLSRELTDAGADAERLRRAYRTAAAVAAAEAQAYRAHCACVFAAVVHADPAVLHRIADRAEVRAVDPAPEVRTLAGTEFRPPLPEQVSAVSERTPSATTSAPDGVVPVAPAAPAPIPSSSGVPVTSDSPDGPAPGSGPSAPASEERPAVPSAPVPDPPSPGPGASRERAGR